MNLKVFAESLNSNEVNELLSILMEIRREEAAKNIRPLIEEEKVMVTMGEYINAIKSYRARLNSSLFEAKTAVHNYQDSIRII